MPDAKAEEGGGSQQEQGEKHGHERQRGERDGAGKHAGRDGGDGANGNDPGEHQAQPAGLQAQRVARHLEHAIEDPGEEHAGGPKDEGGEGKQDSIKDGDGGKQGDEKAGGVNGDTVGFGEMIIPKKHSWSPSPAVDSLLQNR